MPNMPYMPDLYPQGTPFDMGQAGHNPFAFQPGPYGIPYAGAHYQAPFESPMMPQVHTHELMKESDKDEVVEIDIRTNKSTKSKTATAPLKSEIYWNRRTQCICKTSAKIDFGFAGI